MLSLHVCGMVFHNVSSRRCQLKSKSNAERLGRMGLNMLNIVTCCCICYWLQDQSPKSLLTVPMPRKKKTSYVLEFLKQTPLKVSEFVHLKQIKSHNWQKKHRIVLKELHRTMIRTQGLNTHLFQRSSSSPPHPQKAFGNPLIFLNCSTVRPLTPPKNSLYGRLKTKDKFCVIGWTWKSSLLLEQYL